MSRAVTILSVIIICSFSSSFIAISTNRTNNVSNHLDLVVMDITLQDDAFHGRRQLPFIEWWYFDAKLDNGYALSFGVQVLGSYGQGLVTTRLTLYNQGLVVIKSSQKHPLRELSASYDVPSVAIAGKHLIIGTFDDTNDCYVYDISVEIPKGVISLHFTGCTEGWKRQQPSGFWWVVALPRAQVTGTITLGNTTMNVTGTGYHDHNWNVGPRIMLNFGWLWGTCGSSNYSVTWAQMCSTRLTQHPLMVVNEKNGGFLSIPTEMIWFSANNMQIDHFRRIPLFLNIETMTEKVFLVINMEVISVDHTKFFGFIHYWRYHVKCFGSIVIGGHRETVDSVSIVEYLRFR